MLRPTRLRYYATCMEARGFPVAAVLARTGIEPEQLQDLKLLIDAHQCETVIQNMLRLTGNPALGLEIGGDTRLVDFGLLSHAMMSSRTLRQAIQLWMRFYNLAGMATQVRIQETPAGWMTLVETPGMSGVVRQFCVEEALMIKLRVGQALSDQPFQVLRCQVAYPPPPHAALYEELMGFPVHFNAPFNSLEVQSPGLETSLRGNDPEFNEICLRHCSQIMRQMASQSTTVAQLRSLFLAHPAQVPALDEAAEQLGASTRSLRRELQKEGTSYQALVNEFRGDLAQEYLKSEQLTPKEVGFLLGYSDITAFRRAFKSWTGMTVQQFRDGSD